MTYRAAYRAGARALARAIVPPSLIAWSGPASAASRRRVALTFDDGPTPLTSEYLSVLDAFGVRATFFLIGKFCDRYPELVSAIAHADHEITGHGYTHRRFTDLSTPDLRDELERTRSLLPDGGRHRPLVRPPHGAISLTSSLGCALAGYQVVLWSADSGDARTENADDVARRFDRGLEPGAIVLLHEGQGWTLDALPRILKNLKKADHELVTVGELLGDH